MALRGFKTDGAAACLTAIGKARRSDAIAISEGLFKCAHVLLRASQKLVPVKTGFLKSTGHVEGNNKAGFAAAFLVVYDAPYARPVHDNLDAYHASPTQARFLSAAIPKVRGTMTSILMRQLQISTNTRA